MVFQTEMRLYTEKSVKKIQTTPKIKDLFTKPHPHQFSEPHEPQECNEICICNNMHDSCRLQQKQTTFLLYLNSQ